MSHSQNILYDNYYSMTADVLLNISVIASVITILFFTIGHQIEKQILYKQLENILRDAKESFIYNYSKPYFYEELKNNFDNYKPDKSIDAQIDENNDKIFKNTLKLVAIMNGSVIFILFILWVVSRHYKKDMKLGYYISKNIILCIFITFTELFFLFYISKQQMYVDSNFVYKYILKRYINK